MALDTPLDVRSLVIYQVFPRNHGPSGRLADVTADIPRIAALGVDVLYLMPIHPIGEVGRKGTLGSPYAIRASRCQRAAGDARACGDPRVRQALPRHSVAQLAARRLPPGGGRGALVGDTLDAGHSTGRRA